jgi:hypothetical protein
VPYTTHKTSSAGRQVKHTLAESVRYGYLAMILGAFSDKRSLRPSFSILTVRCILVDEDRIRVCSVRSKFDCILDEVYIAYLDFA